MLTSIASGRCFKIFNTAIIYLSIYCYTTEMTHYFYETGIVFYNYKARA